MGRKIPTEEELHQSTLRSEVDGYLLERFRSEVKERVPHPDDSLNGVTIVNPSPLIDITGALVECAREEYGLDLTAKEVKVLGKLDSSVFGGSVKVRPAVQIIEEAIASGKLRRGQVVFEATSGNFGLALGLLRKLGVEVVVLVSRRLQEGVLGELAKDGVKILNLDIDICPAPGLMVDPNLLVAKGVASNLRSQLGELGLDTSVFDCSRTEIEGLLARQDVINLAKLLAKVYGGFCPEQYDNELNVGAHLTVTGPELDQQLKALGHSLKDFGVVCTFGTGGTSTGLGRYVLQKHGKRAVHVVFPLAGQDVAGIRTKEKALGLKFHQPELYAGQHEVDFEAARRVLRFFTSRGFDVGESSALALYACLQMLNYGAGDMYVVFLADGISKYLKSVETRAEQQRRFEVTLKEAVSNLADYGAVIWTHGMFSPKEEGVRLIASSLRCGEDKLKIARASDVMMLLTNKEIPDGLSRLLPPAGRKTLLLCMAGGTSLQVAKLLSEKGMNAESLNGGIMSLAADSGRGPIDLVRIDAE